MFEYLHLTLLLLTSPRFVEERPRRQRYTHTHTRHISIRLRNVRKVTVKKTDERKEQYDGERKKTRRDEGGDHPFSGGNKGKKRMTACSNGTNGSRRKTSSIFNIILPFQVSNESIRFVPSYRPKRYHRIFLSVKRLYLQEKENSRTRPSRTVRSR